MKWIDELWFMRWMRWKWLRKYVTVILQLQLTIVYIKTALITAFIFTYLSNGKNFTNIESEFYLLYKCYNNHFTTVLLLYSTVHDAVL